MDKIKITWENIEKYIKIPIDYRFIDSADIVSGVEGLGRKVVSSQDWYFRVHFPGNPVMPGVLVMEIMIQTGLLIINSMNNDDYKEMVLIGCSKMKMFNSVRPGDILNTHVILNNYSQGIASFCGGVKILRQGEVKELLACTMNFKMQDEKDIQQKSSPKLQLPMLSTSDVRFFDYSSFSNYLADPQEYRFIDKAMVSSNIGIAEKYSSSLDWYYKYNNTFMPFGFLMESIMQTGVLIVTQREDISNPLMMFNDCDQLDIFSAVRPGDVLKTYVTLKSFRNGVAKYDGTAVVGDRKVCEMRFTLILPDEIKKFSERLAERRVNTDAKK